MRLADADDRPGSEEGDVPTIQERMGHPGQRRAVRLLAPATQLRLPALLLLISFAFALGFIANAYFAYAEHYSQAMSEVPYVVQETIRDQTASFLVVSALIAVGYAATVLGFALAYTHRLVGPTVALRRHLFALRNGDCSGRLSLRSKETTFRDITRCVNELTAQLEQSQRRSQAGA